MDEVMNALVSKRAGAFYMIEHRRLKDYEY